MKKRYIWFIVFYVLLFAFSSYLRYTRPAELMMTDVGRLYSKKITKVIATPGIEGLQEAVREAARRDLHISIAGTGHSQGGHTFYENAVVLDMKPFHQIISLDRDRKLLRVQSGATWAQIQDYLNPYDLSVQVMQSSNIFTVGGSLSSNVHGRDVRYGTLIETVESFRLLMADGQIVQVSRNEHSELFGLVIGGFGLFGVIIDVDLRLADNDVYRTDTFLTNPRDFPGIFSHELLKDPDMALTVARLSIAPGSLLNEMYVTTYRRTDAEATPERTRLVSEQFVERNKFLFGFSRKWDWGKSFSWAVQKKYFAAAPPGQLVTRNNAMRPEVEFLEHRSSQNTDILQEYFIPMDRFPDFVGEVREIIRRERLNVLNATVRYVKRNEEALLSYARQDSFAVVLLINQKLSDPAKAHTEQATRQLVDTAIRHGGTYYLTYQLYPEPEQMRAAYPKTELFFAKKREYDPQQLFMNLFYERYAGDGP